MGVSQVAFARHVGVPPDTAWRFGQALGTTPEFWMSLQATYDLARSRPTQRVERIHAAAG